MKSLTSALLCLLFIVTVVLCILLFSQRWWSMYNTHLKENSSFDDEPLPLEQSEDQYEQESPTSAAAASPPSTVAAQAAAAPIIPEVKRCILPDAENPTHHPRSAANQPVLGNTGSALVGIYDVNYYEESVAGNGYANFAIYERYKNVMSILVTLSNYFAFTRDYFYTNSAFAPYQHWKANEEKFNAVCDSVQKVSGKNMTKIIEDKKTLLCGLFQKAGVLESMNWLAADGGPLQFYCTPAAEEELLDEVKKMTPEEAVKSLDKVMKDIQQLNVAVTGMKDLNQTVRNTLGGPYQQSILTRSHADLNTPSDCPTTPGGQPGALRFRQTLALNDGPVVRDMYPQEKGTMETLNRIFLQNPSTPASSLKHRYTVMNDGQQIT